MSDLITRSQVGTMVYLAPTCPLVEKDACLALSGAISECLNAGDLQLILDLELVSLLAGPAMVRLSASRNVVSLGKNAGRQTQATFIHGKLGQIEIRIIEEGRSPIGTDAEDRRIGPRICVQARGFCSE